MTITAKTGWSKTTADACGFYRFVDLDPGTYNLSINTFEIEKNVVVKMEQITVGQHL